MLTATLKTKTCQQCSREFMPARLMQQVCGPLCASRKARKDRVTKEAADRVQTRQKKESMKGLRELLAEAQAAVNAYVRWRDSGLPCICCGKPFEPQKPGGSMDAGHYLARSIAPQHRFNLSNIFGQRKNCNRPGGTTRAAFRAGVISRIGLEAVEALEADNSVKKWTRDELRAIRDDYRARVRAAKKEQA